MEQDEFVTKNIKGSWDKLWRRRKRLYVYRNVVRAAERHLGTLDGRSILEVGCGRGATLLEFARKGASVVGLDYSEEALALCRELKSRNGITGPATFVNGDARKLPFPAESFDFVFSVGLIEHFEAPQEILLEQHRVLRKGGYMLLQVPQRYSLYTVLKKTMIRLGRWPYGGWETQFSAGESQALVRKSGFRPTSVFGYGSFTLALLRHFFFPNLDYDAGGRFWRSAPLLRQLRAHIALDVGVVAQKNSTNGGGHPDISPDGKS